MMSNSIGEAGSDFGKVLAEARKAKNFTIGDINESIKISEHVISAIEASDFSKLPAPAFTRGYLRAYAKFLEISEDNVLDLYVKALPGDIASELKPRSIPPGLTSSHSPVIKMITVFLIITGLAALFYGSFNYYQKKADVMEDELEIKEGSFTGNSLDSLGSQQQEVKQNASITGDGELVLQKTDAVDLIAEEDKVDEKTIKTGDMKDHVVSSDPEADLDANPEADPGADPGAELGANPEVEPGAEPESEYEPGSANVKVVVPVDSQETIDVGSGDDIIEFYAEQGSWMEVRDANNAQLFYNALPEGGSRTFRGQAPFSVSMGNARTTKVDINNIEVDLTGRIRSNNTASFIVSSEEEIVIFH